MSRTRRVCVRCGVRSPNMGRRECVRCRRRAEGLVPWAKGLGCRGAQPEAPPWVEGRIVLYRERAAAGLPLFSTERT